VSSREEPEPYVHAIVAVGEVLEPCSCDVMAVGGAVEHHIERPNGPDSSRLWAERSVHAQSSLGFRVLCYVCWLDLRN
jgi:hypothetical protein